MPACGPLSQPVELEARLQRPGWIISENRQCVHAVAEAPVQGGGAGSLLRAQAGAGVKAPAEPPGSGRVLLGVPSETKR